MSDNSFYDDNGTGIDDRTQRVFGSEEEFALPYRGYYEVRHDKYVNKECVVFCHIN